MSTIAVPARVPVSTILVAGLGVAGVVALLGLRAGGAGGGYLTDPLAAGSWAAAAVVADVARRRLAEGGHRRASMAAALLAGSLLVGLAACAGAVAATASASPIAPVAVAVWSVSWIPPLVLAQLTASWAVRADSGRVPSHAIVIATSAAGMLAGALLWRPTAPFTGIAPMAPGEWPTAVTVAGDVATALGIAGLLVLPVGIARAAATSRDRSRATLALAAAATAASPLVVVFCLLLGIARDPGGVDPTTGSVAFQCAVAAGAAAAAIGAGLAARGTVPGAALVRGLRIGALAVALLLVAGVGTLLAAADLPPTAVALAVAVLAVAAAATGWWGAARLARALTATPADVAAEPVPTASAPRLAELTARESEVLALLADGASNAGIAAQLVLSERTVDAHLRSVFTKLGLGADPGANRRVQAARRWLAGAADAGRARVPAE